MKARSQLQGALPAGSLQGYDISARFGTSQKGRSSFRAPVAQAEALFGPLIARHLPLPPPASFPSLPLVSILLNKAPAH